MASLSHNIEYLAAIAGVKLAQALSPRWADRFGAALGSLAHTVMTSRRHLARDNLKRAIGDRLAAEDISRIVRRVFHNAGRTLIEFARFKKTGQDGVRGIVVGAGLAAVRKAHTEGTGGIILTAHFGNWELLASWFAAQGLPVDGLAAQQHNSRIDAMINGFRRDVGVGVIPVGASTRKMFKALRANHFAVIAGDQHAPSTAVVIEFFGRAAAFARGPAQFAIRCGCPMFPLLLRRERYDRHVMIAGEPIYPPGRGDEEAALLDMTVAYARFLEENVRKYPDQWLWTHRRWKLERNVGNPEHYAA
jgi:KDO2-lipid IV(A) lauroyltransferase